MILVHNSPTTLAPYRTPNLGLLCSPRRVYNNTDGWLWAADNDAYSKWDEGRYREMLGKIRGREGCLFVTAPDVVGDSDATLRNFYRWRFELEGLPVALVGQDGMRPWDVPWTLITALFLGGTSQWKLGEQAAELARAAKARGKWLHMGRVNSHQRVRYAKALGCDSIDGTQFSWWLGRWLNEFLDHASSPTQLMLGEE